MATTFTATTLATPYYSSTSRYTLDAAIQGARWRDTYSADLVGVIVIPSLASVAWTGKIITAASLTVTTRVYSQYGTIRLYGSKFNQYYASNQKQGSAYVDTDNGYTEISLGGYSVGDYTVNLSSTNISWLLSQLRMGRTAFCMYYAGDTATSSTPQSAHYLGVTAFALTITYADAKSTINSVTDSQIGSATTLSWTNYATTGRTCKVRFTLGNTDSGLISASGSSYSYTLPSSWYNELPTATSGTATAYLYTYINDALIGTETANFTASVPSSIIPSIGSISATKLNDNATVDAWDIWLQGYTQAIIAVSGCSAGTGATIASYSFSGQDLTYTDNTSSASSSATSSAIQVDGTHTYTVTITDSRGRTASDTVSVTVLAYAAPNISTASAVRCDADGTVNETTGVYGKAAIKYTWSNVGSNAITNSISYKLHSASVYTLVESNIASWTYSSVFGTLDIALPYDVQGYIIDSLGNSFTYVFTLQSVAGISFGLKNDRARFGGVVSKAGLQIDWPTDIKNKLEINTNSIYPVKINDANGNAALEMINYNGVAQFSMYNAGVERNYIGDGRFSTYNTSGIEVDRISQGGSWFGSNVNHTGSLTVNNKPVVLTVNNTSPDANGNVNVSGGGANATLSSAGWYRVAEFEPTSAYASYDVQGSIGALIRFFITRRYHWTGNETHEVTLSLVYTSIKWMDESSNSVVQGIDKIRYTTNSNTNKGFIDIHYTLSQANQTAVDFEVSCPLDPNGANYQEQIKSMNLTAVADAPVGETILATYSFSANTDGVGTITAGSIGSIHADSWLVKRNNIVQGYCQTYVNGTLSSGWNIIGVLPSGFRPTAQYDYCGVENSSDVLMHIRLYANGNIGVYNTISSANVSYIKVYFSFVL